jgi:flagellum-specific ATP synthase
MPDIVDPVHKEMAGRFGETLAVYRKNEDMINIGAYKDGSNPKVDYAIHMIERLRGYLRQGMDERCRLQDSLDQLQMLFSEKVYE